MMRYLFLLLVGLLPNFAIPLFDNVGGEITEQEHPILQRAVDGYTNYLRRRLKSKSGSKSKKVDSKSGGSGGGGGGESGGDGDSEGFDTVQHNPDGFANLTCHDWVGFKDSQGNNCTDYANNGLWCGLIANQNALSVGNDANFACCKCGGGKHDDPGSTIQNGPP